MPTASPLITVSAATLRGDRPTNQDHIVIVDRALVVLDGATSWLPQDPARDGGWYARTLGAVLTCLLPGHGRRMTDLLAEAIADVRDRFDLPVGTGPSSTVAMLRWDDVTLEGLVLGDSPIVVYPIEGEPDPLMDERLEATAAAERQAADDYLDAGGGYDDELARLIASIQLAERAARNREGGYWIAEADPAAAHRALCRSWPLAGVQGALVMSDGVSEAVIEYRTHSWTDVWTTTAVHGPGAVIREVHTIEAGDPDGVRWPRSKRHDDKALALLAVCQ